MKKLSKDYKTGICLVCAFVLVVALYGLNALYNSRNGHIETEYLLSYSEAEKISVEGIAVRKENIPHNGSNTSILYKQDNLVYVPAVSDSENVAKNGTIAIGFADENQASAYLQEMRLREKLEAIKKNADNDSLDHSNVLFLNSQISDGVSDYAEILSGHNLSSVDSCLELLTSNITSKQSAVGKEINYDEVIDDYNKQIKQLKASYTAEKTIKSPYAGYFVSYVDGYETLISYDDVENKKIEVGDIEKYSQKPAEDTKNAYGKIIAHHTWYYVFDVKVSDASVFRTGYWVSVDFEELGISDIDMKVYDISQEKNDMLTVTLKCTRMNEDLARIRKDSATVTLKEYQGFRISSEAISENEDGVLGVYAVVGNIIRFSPIDILYSADGYAVVQGVRLLRDPENEKQGYYHLLEQYDKIIVKGVNLEDGSIIS